MKAATAILTALLLASCCAHKVEAVSSSSRHADTVATLRSLSARTIDRQVTTETIVIRRDSLGRMVPVSHVIVRHTDKTEDVTSDTSDFKAETKVETKSETAMKETTAERHDKGGRWAMGVKLWLLFAILAALAATYIIRTWESKD